MLRLRIWLGLLAAWFLIFYNIERLRELINIASFVYIMIPVAVAILLAVPHVFAGNRFLPFLTLVLAVYLLLKPILGYPILAAIPTTVMEVVGIVISLLLARQLASVIVDFEDTIAKLTIHQIGMPPRLLDSVDTEELYREVKRSRRFHRALGLMLIEFKANSEGAELNRVLLDLQKSIVTRFIQARLAKLLSEELRDCDLIAQHGERFVVLLPEMDQEQTQQMREALCAEASAKLGLDLHVGLSTFPESGLTLGGLIDAADEHMEQQLASQGTVLASSGD